MKTQKAFKSVLGLAMAATLFVSQNASAQLKTLVAPKRPTAATSNLKAKIKTTEETKSPWSLEVGNIFYGTPSNEDQFVETDITGGYAFNENFAVNLDLGFESYFVKQDNNNGYDAEISLIGSNIELAKDFNLTLAMIGVLPTSGWAHDYGEIGGWGAKSGLSLKLGSVSLTDESRYYQFSYKNNNIPTPNEHDDLTDTRSYSGWNTVAYTTLGAAVPAGPVTLKNDVRYKVKTPYLGKEVDLLRYRARVAYSINDHLGVQAGAYWQRQVNNSASASLFSKLNQVILLQMALDI